MDKLEILNALYQKVLNEKKRLLRENAMLRTQKIGKEKETVL